MNIKKKCLDKNKKVFDERFDLYGIDTYFCKKLRAESIPLTILNSTIEHDLSHITNKNNRFREREVLIANSAALIPYFTLENSLRVIRGLIISIFHREFDLTKSILLSILCKRVIRSNND